MGYRIDTCKPKPLHRNMQKITTPTTIFINNGKSGNFTFPCKYSVIEIPYTSIDEIDCKHFDHNRICCDKHIYKNFTLRMCECCRDRIDMKKCINIHLREEYDIEETDNPTHIIVKDENNNTPSSSVLSYSTSLDQYPDDYTIRLYLKVNDPEAISTKKTYNYHLQFIPENDNIQTVAIGKIVILPAIL